MTAAKNVDRRLDQILAVDEAYHKLDGYRLDRRRVVFLDSSGKHGGFGFVRKAHLRASPYLPTWLASRLYGPPQVVAVKAIKPSGTCDASTFRRDFTKEALVWSRLKGHPGVSEFLGFYFGRSEAWLISPWEQHGDLKEFIRRRELEVPEKLSLACDTIDALAFLHQMDPPVCHGDIKSGNVLVNLEYRAVLCDFGLARLYEDSGFSRLETSTEFQGSVRWCSPELLNGQIRTATSDIYAWAWLVWEIMTGKLPYEGTSADYAIICKIFQGPRSQVDGESRLHDCLQVWELITRCWAVEPLQRPTSAMCKTIFKHLPHCPPVSESADPQTRSAALMENLGDLESWKGNHKAAFAYLEQALHLYEEEGNDKGIANVLGKQAAAAIRDSNHDKILNAASAALEKYRSLQDDIGTANSLFQIGCSLFVKGKRADAFRNLQGSLKIFRAKGDSVGRAKCLERLGELYRCKGLAEKALATLEEAVDVADRCGDRLGEARALIVLGITHQDLDHIDQAITTLQRAHDIAKNIGWEPGLSTCLCRLGGLKLKQGIHTEAEELLRESIRVARDSDAGWRLSQALLQMGKCFQVQGRHEEAIVALEESCSVHQNLPPDFSPILALATALLAGSKSALGYKEEALAWYDRAIAEYRKGGSKAHISKYLAEKGVILVEMSRCDEGALHFEASLIVDQELRNIHGVRRNGKLLSSIPKTVIK